MRNIHNGAQGGRGRKDWGPDEQHRDNPTKKNAIAFALLELAESAGLITSSQRKGSLTTLQRYVEKPALRQILQADDNDPANVKFGRPKADFGLLLKRLIDDLIAGVISSRKNESQVTEYAENLESEAGIRAIDKADLGDGDDSEHGDGSASGGADEDEHEDDKPRPKPLTKIKPDRELTKAIKKTGNDKLANLYHSITSVNAKSHPQLIAVGAWSFLETSAKVCGADEKIPFIDFFKKGSMPAWGFKGRAAGAIHDALVRLSKGGNTTKHDAISASFDHRSIINDMATVSALIATVLSGASS